ncbi:MAG: sporulation integral membrane protein YtvI [Peptococcaceae bacterium]|nr:sporulation integral membrane protein YtvI [Peptococcaceae bacterium]
MSPKRKYSLAANLNRLAVVTLVLVILKTFTYFFDSFLPVFGRIVSSLAGALLPFILALFLAFLLEPVVIRVSNLIRIKRGYASLLSLLLVYGVLGLALFALINRLHTELSYLSVSFPSYTEIVAYMSGKIQLLQHYINLNPQIKTSVLSTTQDFFNYLQTWASSASLILLKVLAALPGTFAVVLVAIVATYLVSSDFPRVKSFLHSVFPKSWKPNVHVVSGDLGSAIYGFLRAEATLIGITMLLTTVGLAILGLDYAFTVGVLTGLLDIVPVVGTGILFVPWILWNLVIGNVAFGLKLLLVWGIGVAMRQFLEPKIMSKNIGLHPLPTLISMYVGLKLLGGWGVILGPTLIIVYQALVKTGLINFPRE